VFGLGIDFSRVFNCRIKVEAKEPFKLVPSKQHRCQMDGFLIVLKYVGKSQISFVRRIFEYLIRCDKVFCSGGT
jgi:hypothetical protein